MPETRNPSRPTALASIGRLLRVLAEQMGATDARPRTLLAGYGRHLTLSAQARAVDLGLAEGEDHLSYAVRALVPERIGSAIVFLNGETAERSGTELSAFVDMAASLASSRIAVADNAADLTDAVIASLDLLHSFLIANGFVQSEYLDATSGEWLDYASSATTVSSSEHAPGQGPEVYEEIVDRERTTTGAANPRDLALAA